MTPAEESLTAAYLAECWTPCRELPRHVRAADAALAAARNVVLAERYGEGQHGQAGAA